MEGDSDVEMMAKRLMSRVAAERVTLGTLQIKNLQALVWWIHDRMVHNQALVAAAFDAEALAASRTQKRVEKERADTDATVSGLPKFKPEEFETADDGFKNLCAQKVGALQTPLKYVIRDAQTPVDFVDDQERRMYQVQLAGRAYEEDNRTVYRMLKEFLFNTAGWAWIQSYDATENGRDAYWAWVNHYNGQGELSKRMQMAKVEIKVLHYKREEAMDFEMYSKKLNRAFQVLDKDPDQRKSAAQKVEILLEGIKTTDTELVACKAVIMQSHASDYDAACAYFSAQVSRLHGGAQLQKQRLKRRIASMESAGRGRGRFERGGSGRFGRGGRSGRGGRGYRGGGGRGPGRGTGRGEFRMNGVDVSDPMRMYTDEEWMRLRWNGGREYVLSARERIQNSGRGRGRGGRGGDTGYGRGRDG